MLYNKNVDLCKKIINNLKGTSMNKKLLTLIIAGIIGTGMCCAIDLDKDTVYYPNANIKSAISKYKNANYSGCLQELFSLTKKEPSNALAYYYMALAYTHINMKDEAVKAYEQVINLTSDEYLTEFATKGKDCLIDGPACKDDSADSEEQKSDEQLTDLDKFIEAPYGNGLSPEINEDNRKKELNNIQKTINEKEKLNPDDIQKIKDFDNKKKDNTSFEEETVKIAQVSDEEVLKAINTLKEAGLTLNVQGENFYNGYQDPQMAQMSMLLGNNNNNNGNMMNMLPMLMSQAQKGENVDPRLMQAMMMNSMMSDFSFNNNNDRY